MSGTDGPAQAGDPLSGAPSTLTSLPWGQIPKFDPNVTDLRIYEQKMRFLHAIWPADHIEHLAPRAALLIEGISIPEGGPAGSSQVTDQAGCPVSHREPWRPMGKLSTEEKYEVFERALYTVVQKADESIDSYLARHDLAFEDLEAKNITIKDIRAYVLVRQSTMSSEDRKKVILDNGGDLTYETARKSMRLLGSKFFQDLQQSGKTMAPKKAYDAYHADEMMSP